MDLQGTLLTSCLSFILRLLAYLPFLERWINRLVAPRLWKIPHARLDANAKPLGPASAVHYVSTHQTLIPEGSTTILSPFDCFEARFDMGIVYEYDSHLDAQKMLRSFEEVLQVFPQLGGYFRKEHFWSADEMHFIEHYFPKVEFVIEQSEDDYPSSKAGFLAYLPVLKTSLTLSDCYPLCRIRLVQFVRYGKDLLGINLNHGVGDMGSLCMIIKYWSAVYRNRVEELEMSPKLIEFDRSLLSKWSVPSDDPRELIPKPVSDEQARQMGFICKPFIRFLPRIIPLQSRPVGYRCFRFSKENLVLFKQILQKQANSADFVLTTNDVLCAYTWKLSAAHTPDSILKDDEEFPLTIVANGKGRMKGIDQYYFGNVLSHSWVCLTKKEIKLQSLLSLSIKIHSIVQNTKNGHFDQLRQFLHQKRCDLGWDNLLCSINAPYFGQGIIVSNWTKFDVFAAADFGSGKPSELHYTIDGSAYGVSTVHETSSGGAIDWKATYYEPTLAKLEAMNITSIQTFQEVAGFS